MTQATHRIPKGRMVMITKRDQPQKRVNLSRELMLPDPESLSRATMRFRVGEFLVVVGIADVEVYYAE